MIRRDEEGVAILTIRRPRVLNALDQGVFDELQRRFAEVEQDDSVQAAVLTGFGVKAFVNVPTTVAESLLQFREVPLQRFQGGNNTVRT